jgi:class 3 adenylate cyclase/tetratricopeptide (TPR) repeat protein
MREFQNKMTAFPDWLGHVGLAHCRSILQAHGIDFAGAALLSVDDLCRLGLNPGDSERLLRALALRGVGAAASSAEVSGSLAAAPRSTFSSSGERRQQLTVMFCDLVGYAGLSQRLDPEDLRDVIVAFDEACKGSLSHYEGHVAEAKGDALVVYFGWPKAHEDDAERCVRSALEIVEAVKNLSAIEPLAAHIGIATGEVVVVGTPAAGGGAVGLAYGAYGEPLNLAARLQGAARANEVLIEPATRRLVGDSFELNDLGTLSLKDFRPSQVWRVEGQRRVAGRFDAARGGAPLNALVGRTKEVASLLRDWHLARGGAGRVVLIAGEAGIGKSRLTEALREQIAGEPHVCMRYQCSPFHLNAALYPPIAQIELAAGFAREDTAEQKLDKLEAILVGSETQRAESAALLAALLSLPTDRYSPLGLSAQKQKEKTLEALIGQVEALSRLKPVLMVVEDVHWIDPTSRELIDALVARLEPLRVMLILTYRPDPQQPYEPGWIASPHVATITLQKLEHDEVVELARNVAKGKILPPEVLKQTVERADGLPLFVEELTRSVLESGLLAEEANHYALLRPLPSAEIPKTLNAFLIERLDRYKRAKELAQIGACMGRVFSYELLAAVSARKGQEVDDDLEQLTGTELLFRRGTPPDATYTFKHALVQDAAYYSLSKRDRKTLHARIADVLEKEFPQSVASEPELLAHHLTEASEEKHLIAAIPLWRRAGESALARVAHKEAVAYLEKGRALVERLPPSTDRDFLELSVREPLHTALLRGRGWATPEIGVNATAILQLAERQSRPQSLLVGLWGMWINTITQGRVAASTAWAERLLAEGRQREDMDLQILGHRARMSSHFYVGELQEALEQRDRVLELYSPQRAHRWMELTGNDVRTAAGVFGSQALWMLGYPDRAAQVSDQKDADSRRLGHPFDIGWALTWGGYVFDYRREPDRLLARVREADRHGREQSIPVVYEVIVPMVEGLALLRKGLLPEAISVLQRGISGWEKTGGNLNLPYLKAALAEALARQGDLQALRLLDECLEQIGRPGWHERVWLAEILRLRGWVLMRQGRRAEAEEQLRASIEQARKQDARSWELRSSTTLAELLIACGRRDDARTVLSPVYDWFVNVSKEGLETYDLRAARTLLDDLR